MYLKPGGFSWPLTTWILECQAAMSLNYPPVVKNDTRNPRKSSWQISHIPIFTSRITWNGCVYGIFLHVSSDIYLSARVDTLWYVQISKCCCWKKGQILLRHGGRISRRMIFGRFQGFMWLGKSCPADSFRAARSALVFARWGMPFSAWWMT